MMNLWEKKKPKLLEWVHKKQALNQCYKQQQPITVF